MMRVRAACCADAAALAGWGLAPAPGVSVLEKDGAVIGALALRDGEVTDCVVAPAWRARGYGTFLLRRALRADGAARVRMKIPPGNDAMAALARKCGFAPGADGRPDVWTRGRADEAQDNAVGVAHAFLRAHVRPGSFALDATAGNGHDTLFLCRLVGDAGRVLALDIQPEAVERTNRRLQDNGCAHIGRAMLDSHAHLSRYARPGSVDAVMFNLGYLPGGDHAVFTVPDVSVPAMRTALELLRPGGVMTVCLYYGGAQGTAERDAALAFLTGLCPRRYRVTVRDFAGRTGCPPIPVCVEKCCSAL